MKILAFVLTAMYLALPFTASATTITFDLPTGTVITNQYAAWGVEFGNASGAAPVIAVDDGNSNSPVLSPNPTSDGKFYIHFPGAGAINVSFDTGNWDVWKSGIITVYNPSNILVGLWENDPDQSDIFFHFGTTQKIGWIYFDSSADTGGAVIDNLNFSQVPIPSTMLLLGSGLVGLLSLGRRRMRK